MSGQTKSTAARVAPLALGLLVACGGMGPEEGNEVETIEVAPGRTSVLTTAYDEVAQRRAEGFSGVLPQDFPRNLPLYTPSNLTDFGDENRGRYVLMFSPDDTTMVRQRMADELRRSGWTLVDGDSERGTYRRGSSSVILDIREARPGTEIRVEY